MIEEIHGVANARKLATGNGGSQAVRVVDRPRANEVELVLSECSYPAGLTPEQAIYVGHALLASAKRVQKAQEK